MIYTLTGNNYIKNITFLYNMYIPNDLWIIIKSYVFDYKKYTRKKKENLLLEFHSENKFWDIENNNIGFWYDSVAKAHKLSNLYSLDRVKRLCHYYNTNQYNNFNIAFAFGPVLLPSSPDYKIPVFWTDNRKGKHPYFKLRTR